MGVNGFLMKLVSTGDLAEMVRKVLDEAKCSTSDYVIRNWSIDGTVFSSISRIYVNEIVHKNTF
jgi:hypothetical protein